MGKFSAGVKKHSKTIAKAFAVIGTAAAAAATKIVVDYANAGDEIQKMALRTGFTTEALSELRHAAELSGTSIQGIAKAVKRMATTLLDAEQGLSTAVDAMNELNLTIGDFEGLSPEAAFEKFLVAIANLEDPLKRAAVAQDIFGRAGVDLIPIMSDGVDGLRAMREEAHELGIVFDQEAADAAAKFNDSLTVMRGQIKGVTMVMAEEWLPTIQTAIELLAELAKGTAFLTTENKAYSAILEINRRLGIEGIKLNAGLENSYKETAEEMIAMALALKKAADQGIGYNLQISALITPLREWLAEEEKREKAIAETTEQVTAVRIAEMERMFVLDGMVLAIEKAIQAEKDLAQAQADAAAAHAARTELRTP